jgi:hypothetical protein
MFEFAYYGYTAGSNRVFKNRDSPRVSKNQSFSAKWIGEEKPWRQESKKTHVV